MTSPPPRPRVAGSLERRLGLASVVAISLGAMLGSGVFVLPGVAAATCGPNLWLAYLLAGLCVLPAALSKSELATAMPVSGGSYVYVDRAIGPLASTIIGLGLWISLLLKSAFALVGFGAYLGVMSDVPLQPVSMGLLVAIAALNVLGVKKVGRVQSLVVSLTLAALAVVVVWGLAVPARAAPDYGEAVGTWSLLATVGMVYISYAGVTKVAAIAEEVRDPGRNLPLGILISLLVATLLYTSVTWVMTHHIPRAELAGDLHPVWLLADTLGGRTVGLVAAGVAVLTMVSMANSGLLASSRFPFAMARDGLMPSFLRRVDPRFLTPVPAIFTTAVLMGIAILFLDVQSLAKLASATMILGFLAVNLAVIVLRESSTQWYQPAWRSPFYPGIQVAGILLGVVLLSILGATGLIALAVTALGGTLVFLWIGRGSERSGVLGRLGPRHALLAGQEEGAPAAALTAAHGLTVDPSDEPDGLPSRAQVVVPLLGQEPSPETLALMGASLSSGGTIEVLRLRELPDQTIVDAIGDEDRHVHSLRRRIAGLAEKRGLDMAFDAVSTHDAIRLVHDVSRRVHCEWLVMEWSGRRRGRWLLFNPLGWLVGHLECNLALFKDAGIRTFRSILVLAEPGPDDALLVGTADHLARVLGAQVTLARFVPDSAPAMVAQGESDYLDQLAGLLSRRPEARIVRGTDPLAALAELTADHDLLLLGAPPQARFADYLRGSLVDRLTRAASCSVLRLKTPRTKTHEALGRARPAAGPSSERRSMAALVPPGSCAARLTEQDKEALFGQFAAALAGRLAGVDAASIEEALWARERTQNTSVGLGMALPHATLTRVDRTYLALFTTAAPIDYRAPDGGPVDVFLVTVGPPSERKTHLEVLAGLSRMVLGSGLLEALRGATNGDELLAALRAAEAPGGPAPTKP